MPSCHNARPDKLIRRKIGTKIRKERNWVTLMLNDVFCPMTWIIRATSQLLHADPLQEYDAFAVGIREVALDTTFVIVTRSCAAGEGFAFV